MNKNELVNQVAADINLTKADCLRILEATIETAKSSVPLFVSGFLRGVKRIEKGVTFLDNLVRAVKPAETQLVNERLLHGLILRFDVEPPLNSELVLHIVLLFFGTLPTSFYGVH